MCSIGAQGEWAGKNGKKRARLEAGKASTRLEAKRRAPGRPQPQRTNSSVGFFAARSAASALVRIMLLLRLNAFPVQGM
eukprot:5837048-Prymnesium_polylepis.1